MLLKRLFSSWMFTSLCFLLPILTGTALSFTDKGYSEAISFPSFILFFILFFSLITLAKKALRLKSIDDTVLILSTALYSMTLASKTDDLFVCMSIIAAVSVAIISVVQNKELKIYSYEPSKKLCIACVAVLGCSMAVFISIVTAFRYLTFSSPNFDFGIFCNMFYNMAKDFSQTVSCERDMLLSHFAVHFSPVYYLILPIYFIIPHPITLQVMQAVIVASGIIPVYLICRQQKLSRKATVCFSAIYVLFPALSGGCFYDIHENCFLAPFIMWLLYSFNVNGLKGIILKSVFTLLTLSVKEDAFIYVIFAGIYLFFSAPHKNISLSQSQKAPDTETHSENISIQKQKKAAIHVFDLLKKFFARFEKNNLSKEEYRDNAVRRISAVCMIALAVCYFGFTSWYLTNYGLGVMTNRYDNFINGDAGLLGAVRTVLTNPIIALTESFTSDKLSFAFYMLIPLAFLPFVSKKPARFVLVLPFILVNMMPDYVYQHSIYFQYIFASSSFLIYAAIVNCKDITSVKLKRSLIAIAVASSIICCQVTILGYSRYVDKYMIDKERYIELEEALQTVPKDATVSSTTFYLPHLASRDEIYQCSIKDQPVTRTDYVVLDIRGVSDAEAKIYIEMYENCDYTNTVYINELVLIFASDEYTEQHSNTKAN